MQTIFKSEWEEFDVEKRNMFDLKLRLGLVKREKKPNPFKPFKRSVKQSNFFQRSKCTFNSDDVQAYSYGWWKFVDKIGDNVIFNDYNYSNTTRRHQWDTRSLMYKLGINIDIEVECRLGLQSIAAFTTAVDDYKYKIKQLKMLIAKPRSHKAKNQDRLLTIQQFNAKIKVLRQLDRLRKKEYYK